jgi:hypothetical protein
MPPHSKRSAEKPATDLDFATTQEIDPAFVDAVLRRADATLAPGDFDETEVLPDLGATKKPATKR